MFNSSLSLFSWLSISPKRVSSKQPLKDFASASRARQPPAQQPLAAALLAPKGPSKQTPTDTDTNRYDSKRFAAIVFDTM